MEAGRSRSEVARELGFPEATLRNWMEATNGVGVTH
jgi:transposase-like protein